MAKPTPQNIIQQENNQPTHCCNEQNDALHLDKPKQANKKYIAILMLLITTLASLTSTNATAFFEKTQEIFCENDLDYKRHRHGKYQIHKYNLKINPQ